LLLANPKALQALHEFLRFKIDEHQTGVRVDWRGYIFGRDVKRAQFRAMTTAMLVGQPIGERPNSYQEPRLFTLENSHLVCAIRRATTNLLRDETMLSRQTRRIPSTWEDYKNGHDAVLEWVLAFKESGQNGG